MKIVYKTCPKCGTESMTMYHEGTSPYHRPCKCVRRERAVNRAFAFLLLIMFCVLFNSIYKG